MKPIEAGCKAIVTYSEVPEVVGKEVDVIKWIKPGEVCLSGKILDPFYRSGGWGVVFKHIKHTGTYNPWSLMRIDGHKEETKDKQEIEA